MEWPGYGVYDSPPLVLQGSRRPHRGRPYPSGDPSQQNAYYTDENGILVPAGPLIHGNPYGHMSSDPLAPYALPISRPPGGSGQRHRARTPAQIIINNDQWDYEPRKHRPTHHARDASQDRDRNDTWQDHDTLTDVESDVSDAVSGDSFMFDCSVSAANEKQTEDAMSSRAGIAEATNLMNGSKLEKPTPYILADLCVYYSRFNGDPLEHWDCTATLSACQSPINVKQQEKSLFKWIHLKSQHQSLSAFLDYLSTLPNLSRVESEHAVALVHLLRQKSEHAIPTVGATKGKYLESNLTSWRPSLRYPEGKEAGRVHFLCLPYFALDSYKAHQYATTSDAHPIRSLLQTQYPSAATERDMQQAVCQLQGSDQQLCYHVPQLWCLYVENKLLITSSRLSMDETQRPFVNVDMANPPNGPPIALNLHVSDSSGRTWIIPLSECSTWLDFVAQFSTLTSDFESEYYVMHRDAVQIPENWQSLIALAKKQTLRLIIRSKCSSKRPQRARVSSSASSSSSSSVEEPLEYTRSGSPTVIGSKATVEPDLARPRPETFKTDSWKGEAADTNSSNTEDIRSKGRTKTTRADIEKVWVKNFHLFFWLAVVPKPTNEESRSTISEEDEQMRKEDFPLFIDKQQLNNRTSQMHKYLVTRHRVGRRAYAQCPTSTLSEIEARKAEIDHLAREKEGREKTDRRRRGEQLLREEMRLRDVYDEREFTRNRPRSWSDERSVRLENRRSRSEIIIGSGDASPDRKSSRTIVRLAKQLFEFFFPLDCSSNMIKKYWGAVHALLHRQESLEFFKFNYMPTLLKIRSLMRPLARSLRYGPPPATIDLPIELSRAWLHLLSFWVLVGTERSSTTLQAELDKCHRLLENGRTKLLRMRTSSPLRAYEAVLPPGILSLLVNKLAGDVSSGSPDIEATYYAYVTKLEDEVQRKPYSRGHQEKITSVRQEINCVLAVLQDQIACITQLRSTLMKGKLDAPPGFPQRREAYVLQNCLASISDRIQNFRALDERARGIAAFNLYRIESNRDRQEGAILVFTIVTIIFLPLSFVSSFFGMNTSDIRNMTTPQWAFWASAIPLTTVVVGVSIFVARKIEPVKNLWNSLADRWKAKPDAGNLYPAPAVVAHQPVPRVMSELPRQRAMQNYEWPAVEPSRPRRRHTGRSDY